MRQHNHGPLFSEVPSIFWKISDFTQSLIIDTVLFSFQTCLISFESITIQIGFNFKLLLLFFIFLFDLIILFLLSQLFNSRVASFWIVNPYSILISFWLREDSIMIAFILLFIYFYKKDKTGFALLFYPINNHKHLFIFSCMANI